jgi:glycosyltransferase involved in cell wall biosynthesis
MIIQLEMPKKNKYPFVSICTPTFNRRPFLPIIIQCFYHQIYPKNRMEWIIIDDGTDKIGDLVKEIPNVKYFSFDEKMTLGKKRNLSHTKCKGDIIVYMDDDDYYPPTRISHAVDMLQSNPNKLCAGSSIMYIYYKHISKLYQFGPYGENHATAATFAFKKELLKQTSYDETASVAEEKSFLKNYTIPFIQLNPQDTILVFSHIYNSFDKKKLLTNDNPYCKDTTKQVSDFVKEAAILKFFLIDIDSILETYQEGDVKWKPDVVEHLSKIENEKNRLIQEHNQKIQQYNELVKNATMKMQSQQPPPPPQPTVLHIPQLIETLQNFELKMEKMEKMMEKILEKVQSEHS